MIYAERVVTGHNRFYSGHLQNTSIIKTFFGCAEENNTSENPVEHVKYEGQVRSQHLLFVQFSR